MASASSTFKFSSLLAALFAVAKMAIAGDPFAGLLFLVDGSLRVGFVDTTNKLFTQTLQAGDMFVFPKGLVHFHHNADARNHALAISAFGSAGAGTVSLPTTLFSTSIDDNILAKPFKIDVATIQALTAGPASKP
ncbi:germin protein [Salix suchowensis]|nr:germin protein [Salix suchowensis]